MATDIRPNPDGNPHQETESHQPQNRPEYIWRGLEQVDPVYALIGV